MLDWVTWWWTMPATVIEAAGPDDCGAMADIHADGFAHDWSAEDLAGLMRQQGVFALIARRANVLGTRSAVGFVLVRHVLDEAEILTIAVSPSQQGRGIGRKLMDAAFRRLYHDRVASVFLEVDAGNPPALALYRRLGFEQVGERKAYYAIGSTPGAAALVMRAVLG
jgi:ribosomal-protein-alanine N-acetyltransferase